MFCKHTTDTHTHTLRIIPETPSIISLQCGYNTTKCPPPPKYHKDDKFAQLNLDLRWINNVINFLGIPDFGNFFKLNFGKLILIFWFIVILLVLGVIKYLHSSCTSQSSQDMPTNPMEAKMFAAKKGIEIKDKIIQEIIPGIYDSVTSTFQTYTIKICACFGQGLKGEKDFTAYAQNRYTFESGGWRRPVKCNGMCSGAKVARHLHRKQMRINKRKGAKSDTVWYQKPYRCSCKVR